jgi:hypothetical protein
MKFGTKPTRLFVQVSNRVSGSNYPSQLLPFFLLPTAAPSVGSVAGDPQQFPPMMSGRGATTFALITGENLFGATVSVSGGGVTVSYGSTVNPVLSPPRTTYDSDPFSAPSDTSLKLSFYVEPDAAPGIRTVSLTTAAGTTSSCGNQACTFSVIDAGSFTRIDPPVNNGSPSPPAVLLTDGRVLVGGLGLDLNQAALFDPTSNKWTLTGSLNTGRRNFGASLLPDGRVLVAGGTKVNNTPTSSAEIFDPATGKWTTTGSMKEAIGNAVATLLTGGTIAISSATSAFSDEYDHVNGIFTGVAPPGDARLFTPSSWTTLLLDGRILLRKDTTPACFSAGCGTRQVRVYAGFFHTPSFSNGSWELGPGTANSAAFSGTGVLAPNGKVIAGGQFLYDPDTDSTITIPGNVPLALLHDGRVLELTGVFTLTGLNNPTPSISNVTSENSPSPADPIILTIDGSNFLPNSKVKLGTQALVSIFLGSQSLVAFVPAALRNSFNIASLTVTNPSPGGGTASPSGLLAGPTPVISRVLPSSGTRGTRFEAQVIGTGLYEIRDVRFSGSGITASVLSAGNGESVPILVTIDDNAPLGMRSITVTSPVGGYTFSDAFAVQGPRPAISSTAPEVIPEVELGNVRSGYAIITPNPNSLPPLTTVTFGIVNGGAVQSQAGLIPSPMTTDASLFIELIPSIRRNLAVAIANPAGTSNTVTLTIRDESGAEAGSPIPLTLQPGQLSTTFVNDLFEKQMLGPFRGSLHIQGASSFAVHGLRFSGTLFSTMPSGNTVSVSGIPSRTLSEGSIADAPAAGPVGGINALIVPQFSMGGGWATQLALVNSTTTTMTGRIDIFDSSGNPMIVRLNGGGKSTFRYSIAPGGTFVLAPRDVNGQSPF